MFHFITAFRPALEPAQPPSQWVPEEIYQEVKQPGHEADHSPLSAKVKNAFSYTSTPQYVSMAWCSGTGTLSSNLHGFSKISFVK
jgi:hypothetical protein